MRLSDIPAQCQTKSDKEKFGLCDDTSPAYLDENEENEEDKWIAFIENTSRYEVTFTAIDHCIEMTRDDGKQLKRCDGMLEYVDNILFVELKNDGSKKNKEWRKKGIEQLKATIDSFKENDDGLQFPKHRRACLANRKYPQPHISQAQRMERFKDETGFVLTIQQEIIL